MASLRDPLPDGRGSVERSFYGPNRTPTVREGILRQHKQDIFYAVKTLEGSAAPRMVLGEARVSVLTPVAAGHLVQPSLSQERTWE